MDIWWQKIKRLLMVVGIIVACMLLIALIIGIIGGYLFNWGWTGIKTKTLWDWLNLLAVLAIPVVVGFGAAWFTAQQGKVSDAENKDNQRERALQAYIDKMSELLLEKDLRKSGLEDEVRRIAHARTRTVLPSLNPMRKRSLLGFLYECRLIDRDNPIVDLHYANLSEAKLRKVILYKADLRGAGLRDADLSEADLRDTDLSDTYLYEANLEGADLQGADLSESNLTGAYLKGTKLKGILGKTNDELEKQAKSLEGATMPDGSIHP